MRVERKHRARLLLGDVVAKAIESVGVTPELIQDWLGFRCNCKERRDKLNWLDLWARQVIFGKDPEAEAYLRQRMQDEKDVLDEHGK
jgi:hypothetical protein